MALLSDFHFSFQYIKLNNFFSTRVKSIISLMCAIQVSSRVKFVFKVIDDISQSWCKKRSLLWERHCEKKTAKKIPINSTTYSGCYHGDMSSIEGAITHNM